MRAFYWLPMRPLPTDSASVLDNDFELDRAARGSSITGFFYTFPTFANEHRLEAYLFDLDFEAVNEPLLAADHVSVGARAYRAPKASQWNYEVEAVLQRGDSGGSVGGVVRTDLDHRASFLHAEIGYQFDLPGSPNLMLQYDRATGDEDPTDASIERFNTLFGARRFDFGPTGIYGIAARSNIDSPGVRLTFRPAERWQAMLSYRSLRLAGSPRRLARLRLARYVGGRRRFDRPSSRRQLHLVRHPRPFERRDGLRASVGRPFRRANRRCGFPRRPPVFLFGGHAHVLATRLAAAGIIEPTPPRPLEVKPCRAAAVD